MRSRNRNRALCMAALAASAWIAAPVRADEADDAFAERVRTAMASEARTPEEKARDRNRKPVETLAFFGLRGDMDVLELVPGGGWYSKLLAPSLADAGSLSVWIGLTRYADRFTSLDLEDVAVVGADSPLVATQRRGVFDLPAADLGSEAYDAVLTFRNVHNLTPEGRATLNRAVFAALRPGGVYGVVDHTRRHMQPDDPENRRRLDPVLMIHEALAAGFVFEASSDLHYHLDDELRYEVGRRSVSGNSDRFTLRFRKPE